MLRRLGKLETGSGVRALCAMLYEEEPLVQEAALVALTDVCHDWWFLITEHLDRMTAVVRPDSPMAPAGKETGNILVAKILFHLAALNYDASLKFAVRAPDRFLQDEYRLFVDKVMVRGLDRYQDIRAGRSEWGTGEENALKALAGKIQQKSLADAQWKESIGFALDSSDPVALEAVISQATAAGADVQGLISYTRTALDMYPPAKSARKALYLVLAKLYRDSNQILAYLEVLSLIEDAQRLSEELRNYANGPHYLIAYQAAFDLIDNCPASYVRDVHRCFGSPDTEARSQLVEILSGTLVRRLYQHFYVSEDAGEKLAYLLRCWTAIRHPVAHTAAMIAHSFIHMGSGNVDFIARNLEWADVGVRWSEFTSAATLGILYKHNEGQGMDALSTVLPKRLPGPAAFSPSSQTQIFSFGGGLFGLGLLSANSASKPIVDYFVARAAFTQGPLRAGLCLGLATTAMGCQRRDLLELVLKVSQLGDGVSAKPDPAEDPMTTDPATVGSAGAIAAGLIMTGSGSAAHDRLYQLACDTPSETIRRGLSVALALLQWSQGQSAATTIQVLCKDELGELRRAGVLAAGTAFVGTADTAMVDLLMSMAAMDASSDVRRAAGAGLGLVIAGLPHSLGLGFLVPLLCSHCPHTRYGGLLALAISAAGSANNEALTLLAPMMEDNILFVREGAMVAAALIGIGANDRVCPAWKTMRELTSKLTSKSPSAHEVLKSGGGGDDPLLLFGSIISMGITYAAGGAAAVSTTTSNGQPDHQSLVGLLLFTEHWNWFPNACFLSLAIRPLSTFVLNDKLDLVKVGLRCRVREWEQAPVSMVRGEVEVRKTEEYSANLSTSAPRPPPPARKERSSSAHSLLPTAATASSATVADAETQGPVTELELANGSRMSRVALSRVETTKPLMELIKPVPTARHGSVIVGQAAAGSKVAAVPLKTSFTPAKGLAHAVEVHHQPAALPPNMPILFFAVPPPANLK